MQFPFRLITIDAPITLYHSTGRLLPQGYPTNPGGNWFSLDKEQSIYHIINKYFPIEDEYSTCEAYLYEYNLRHPIQLIELDGENFPTVAKYFLNRYLLPFTYDDVELAEALCKAGISGWIFTDDQRQVMLCNPVQDLIINKYNILPQTPEVISYCRHITKLLGDRENLEQQLSKIMRRDPDSRKIGRYQDYISDLDKDLNYLFKDLHKLLPQPEFVRLDPFGHVINNIEQYRSVLSDTPNVFLGWKALYHSPMGKEQDEEYMEQE